MPKSRKRLAEQKFRPLKKAMQQTFKRIRQAVQNNSLPERGVINEFVEQAKIMVSYPGFGDAAYPEFLSASTELAASYARADLTGCQEAVTAILALQCRCHAACFPPALAGGETN